MTVLEAAESGTHRDLLVALRALLARTIDDGCPPRDLVGLTRRLIDVSEEIRRIDAPDATPGLRVVDEKFDPAAI